MVYGPGEDQTELERDQELSQFEADANRLRAEVRSMQERWEQHQAELEQLRADLAGALTMLGEYYSQIEQAKARAKRLEEAGEMAHTELEKVEQYFVKKAKAQSTSKEEALLRSIFSEPYMAVVKAQAVLAEGDADAS